MCLIPDDQGPLVADSETPRQVIPALSQFRYLSRSGHRSHQDTRGDERPERVLGNNLIPMIGNGR